MLSLRLAWDRNKYGIAFINAGPLGLGSYWLSIINFQCTSHQTNFNCKSYNKLWLLKTYKWKQQASPTHSCLAAAMASKICILHIPTIISIFLPHAKSIHFNFPAVFNFGDSNSDTGELIASGIESLVPPNGQSYFQKPSGRYCDGRLIIDFLCNFCSMIAVLWYSFPNSVFLCFGHMLCILLRC